MQVRFLIAPQYGAIASRTTLRELAVKSNPPLRGFLSDLDLDFLPFVPFDLCLPGPGEQTSIAVVV